ncbi:MAG: MATE family efflux transporter [Lachnospiraceae bacterium]|nr:MATE family efflux transporter [Lachnospiraceae bacterium]MDD3616772.1 MATE family efflux transporter [Lachnospiraceae bacterium]
MEEKNINDFSKGAMWKNILSMAIPVTAAQLVQLLYNIVDRIYIGHMQGDASLALTGVGLTFPIISLITAFSLLFSSGGAPLCSIERGRGNHERAEKLLGNCFCLLLITGCLLMVVFYVFMKPILYAFGASDVTYPFASSYLTIYLIGTLFVMISTGMNMFINSQGFGKVGMATTMIGAVCNIILDPIFIFVFHMGVQGAALATIISQGVSALWVFHFLTGKKPMYKIKKVCMKLNDLKLILDMVSLGLSGFVMAVTNSLTQIVCNATLQTYGGDIYVGSMTILNSVREIFTLATQGITSGAQPVLGFNYGAGEYDRVKQGIKFMTGLTVGYTVLAWLVIDLVPQVFIGLFTSEPELMAVSIPSLRIFFGGFFMMSLQFSGQSTFVALGYSKHAVFFSLLRKAIIVVPLTLILPRFMGINGVFYAEPISNYIGGTACFVVMLLTVWPRLSKDTAAKNTAAKNQE